MVGLRFSKKKIRIIIFRLILILVLLEIGLRISGFGFMALQRYGNIISEEKVGIYRILVLGDSITANLRNGQSSWPEELEIVLNNRSSNIKFKVFNEGAPGATGPIILSNLEGNLDRYNPDIVIAMMGHNDEYQSGINEGNMTFSSKSVLKGLRLYKMANTMYASMKNKIKEKQYNMTENRLKKAVNNAPLDKGALVELGDFYVAHEDYEKLVSIGKKIIEVGPDNPFPYAGLGLAYHRLKMYKEAEEMFKKALELNPNIWEVYITLGDLYRDWNKPREAIEMYKAYFDLEKKYDEDTYIKLARAYMDINNSEYAYKILAWVTFLNPDKGQELFWIGELYEELSKFDEMYKILDTTIQKNPNNIHAYIELAWYHINNNRTNEAEEVFNTVMQINPHNLITLYDHISYRYRNKGKFEKANEMFNRASELRKKYYNPTTRQNYRELYDILNKRKIKLVVVQYPNLDVEDIKKIFREDEEIIFVSNKENFRKSLVNLSSEEYFVNLEEKVFGHLTKKGNQLVAKNAANNILNELEIN